MNGKASASASLMLVLLTVSLFGALNAVAADPIPGMPTPRPLPSMPSIIIGSDGNITPSNMPISIVGNLYTLTGNITNYSIIIQCSNIIFEGAGYTVQCTATPYVVDLPSTAIIINANNVTVKNTSITGYYQCISVSGEHNTITYCTMTDSPSGEITKNAIALNGDNNNLIGSTLTFGGVDINGNYNQVERNFITGSYAINISPSRLTGGPIANYNTVAANTIQNCTYFAVYPSTGINIFYLNNFINNKPESISAQQWQLVNNGKPISMDQWTPTATWTGIYVNGTLFDNGKQGNYWSDYKGTDANGDGIGDAPYFIGGTLQDNYPLMSPVDIANVNIPTYQWGSDSAGVSAVNLNGAEQQQIQDVIFVLSIVAATLIAGVIASTVLKKRRKK